MGQTDDEDIELVLEKLVQAAALHHSVRAIGLSGGERPFPRPGEGDLDFFIYCLRIPDLTQRSQMIASLGGFAEKIEIGRISGGHWGQGDCCFLSGIETWFMYFTVDEAQGELDDILAGKFLGQVDSAYYPLGRCAMWKTMRALCDPDGILETFRARLAEYPRELAKAVVAYHLAALQDVEDLERAVRRQDVFFYHFAFDMALDHFLQALFALNLTFFPSRKRSEEIMQRFRVKPVNCEQQLRQAVASGGSADTLQDAYLNWQDLVSELNSLSKIR